MIIMCEKCEKKFRVDPERITGEQARFRCRNCGNWFDVWNCNPPRKDHP